MSLLGELCYIYLWNGNAGNILPDELIPPETNIKHIRDMGFWKTKVFFEKLKKELTPSDNAFSEDKLKEVFLLEGLISDDWKGKIRLHTLLDGTYWTFDNKVYRFRRNTFYDDSVGWYYITSY